MATHQDAGVVAGVVIKIVSLLIKLSEMMENKSITEHLAARLSCEYATAQHLLDGFSAILKEQCGEENRVAIPGFGTFDGVKHDEEIANDLSSGKRMLMPPYIEIRFTAGGMLKKRLKGGVR